MRAAASSGAARCLVKGSSQCLARVPTARHLGPRCALPAALWPARSLVSASRFSINPWSIVDGLRGPWLLTDAVLDRLGVTANHSALDRFVAALRGTCAPQAPRGHIVTYFIGLRPGLPPWRW